MTRYELLEALAAAGEDGADVGFDHRVNWNVGFANGDAVLTVTFTDDFAEASETYEWVLTPKETN